MNKKFLIMGCCVGMMFGIHVELNNGINGDTLGTFELENSTVGELKEQIQLHLGLDQDDYQLVCGTKILSKDDVLPNAEENAEKCIIKLIKCRPIYMTTSKSAVRGEDLIPNGYAYVNYEITIYNWQLELKAYFFEVNSESICAEWKKKQRMRINLDEDPGNFVALLQQGYNLHDEVMKTISENYNKLLSDKYYGCLYGEYQTVIFAELYRKADSTQKPLHKKYVDFDDIIGWGLCTLLNHKFKPEIPIRPILSAIINVIYDLNNEESISEAEVHKRFIDAVFLVVEKHVRTKIPGRITS